ncbi:hypothetical protein [Streptomyces sp. NPDC048436]|uniref:hypothetical protein n=1 Tax=Streptomyces sp. NPDC048436 TaxID=3365550 RepID=UPI0037187B77
MNKTRRISGLTPKLAGMVAATLAVLAVTQSAAAAPQEPAAAVKALSCSTDTDGYWGHAHCTNNTDAVTAFRVVVVCGGWPDAYGDWKTLKPGESDVSSARCLAGSGVGSVRWEEG